MSFREAVLSGTRRQRLAFIPWKPPYGAIKGRIVLVGSKLQVSIEGAKPLTVDLVPEMPSPQGLVRLEVYDRIRGAARADFVSLVLTSLSKPHH